MRNMDRIKNSSIIVFRGFLCLFFSIHLSSCATQKAETLASKGGSEIAITSAYISSNYQPLLGGAGGRIQNVTLMQVSSSIPEKILKGKVSSEGQRSFISIPEEFASLIVNISVDFKKETTIKVSQLALFDKDKNKYAATFWDLISKAWVADQVTYNSSPCKDSLLFIVPKSSLSEPMELKLGRKHIAILKSLPVKETDIPAETEGACRPKWRSSVFPLWQ